jgi:hypothetical protein
MGGSSPMMLPRHICGRFYALNIRRGRLVYSYNLFLLQALHMNTIGSHFYIGPRTRFHCEIFLAANIFWKWNQRIRFSKGLHFSETLIVTFRPYILKEKIKSVIATLSIVNDDKIFMS